MMHTPNAKGTPKTGRVRFPGICRDAAFLGVNRSTLYRVLNGEWPQLKTLRRRYDALKTSQKGGR